MLDTAQSLSQIAQCVKRLDALNILLNINNQKEELQNLSIQLEDSAIWQDLEKSKALGKKRTLLEKNIAQYDSINNNLKSAQELLELISIEQDESILPELNKDIEDLNKQLDGLEFQQMFSNELDSNDCYLEIQSGSGGTEAQDWADMLLRQYLRWIERHQFKAEILEYSDGEVAGIKSATVKVIGDYAYGWLRTETGVHRLVRKSPFNANNKRHTSFASVFISPEIDDNFEIDLNPADIRVDVYRASGAGGQHVNRTESAVRLTHLPTNTVTQCQNSRSQHSNKAEAMKQLRAKLYELEIKKQNSEKQKLEDSKSDIGWGSQIRSYVLDSGRIKDLRTGIETGNTQAVLDGDLDDFIIASLKNKV
jgi:peptide chain release factor 2